jgi:hypothetical protein
MQRERLKAGIPACLLALLVLATLAHSAETNTVNQARRGAWYTQPELERVTKDYVSKKRIQFSFEGTTNGVSYRKVGTNVVARIWFASDFGKPVFTAEIDHTGTVLTNSLGISVCGFGDSANIMPPRRTNSISPLRRL